MMIYDQDKLDPTLQHANEEHAVLIDMVIDESVRTGTKTIVVSPTALSILLSGTCKHTNGLDFRPHDSLKHVGSINGDIDVYVDEFGDDEMPIKIGEEEIILKILNLCNIPTLAVCNK